MTFYTGLRGEQLEIPGTRLSPKEKLQRDADKPLAPDVPQKAADVGIFDTEGRKQTELLP